MLAIYPCASCGSLDSCVPLSLNTDSSLQGESDLFSSLHLTLEHLKEVEPQPYLDSSLSPPDLEISPGN